MARIGEDKYRPYMKDTGMQTGAGRIAGQPSTGTAQDNTNQRVTQPVQRLGTEYWRKDAGNAQDQQNGAGDAAGAGAGGGGGGGGGYTQDPYAAQANALYQQLLQRGPFQYDLQGDMLYRQYADQYSQMGQTAMRDAMGTAAGLTGGYGNSWAGTVGNQAYQQYLGQLNAMIPDFYDRAYQRWLDEGDDMLTRYQLALGQAQAGGGGGSGGAEGSANDGVTGQLTFPTYALDSSLPASYADMLKAIEDATADGSSFGTPQMSGVTLTPDVINGALNSAYSPLFDYYNKYRGNK